MHKTSLCSLGHGLRFKTKAEKRKAEESGRNEGEHTEKKTCSPPPTAELSPKLQEQPERPLLLWSPYSRPACRCGCDSIQTWESWRAFLLRPEEDGSRPSSVRLCCCYMDRLCGRELVALQVPHFMLESSNIHSKGVKKTWSSNYFISHFL